MLVLQLETLPDGTNEMQGMHWGDAMRQDFAATDWDYIEELWWVALCADRLSESGAVVGGAVC